MEQSKSQLAKNREMLIKMSRRKKGEVLNRKVPTEDWYENWDRTFKGKVK
jgi:hypothetical protein